MTTKNAPPLHAYKLGDLNSGNWSWAVGIEPTIKHRLPVNIATINFYGVRHFNGDAEKTARLFAASHDMLAALKDCVESLDRMPNVEGAYRATVKQQALAAIAKAEGGQ